MQILKRVNIVRSRRGTEGGYTLTRPPGQITVGDVIRAMSGPFVQLSCADSGHFDGCGRQSECQFKPIWTEVDRAIGNVLNNITFEELVRRERANQRPLMYHI
jgi:Rrf2 family protein